MHFLRLLGRHLKSDDVIDLLETYDIAVTYDFDRTHENMDDAYWAEAKEYGFVLRFDQRQVLDTVFLYMSHRDGYLPVDPRAIDVPVYPSMESAQAAATSAGIPFQVNGEMKDCPNVRWIKLKHERHAIHYQFDNGRLSLITLSTAERTNDA